MFQSRILSLQCSLIFKSFFSSMDELQISGRSSVASSRPKPKPKTLVSCYTSHFRRYGLLLRVRSETIVSFNFTNKSKFEVNYRYDSRFLRIIFDSNGLKWSIILSRNCHFYRPMLCGMKFFTAYDSTLSKFSSSRYPL